MEIPFSALVAVAVRYHTFYEDLLDKWGNSLRLPLQQRKRPAPAADAAAPAGDLLEMAVPSRPQQSSLSRSGSLASNARERGSGKSGHHRLSSSKTDKQQQQHRRGSGKNISNHQQRHRKRSGSQSSTASSTTFSSSRK
jgi:hypothetical protein